MARNLTQSEQRLLASLANEASMRNVIYTLVFICDDKTMDAHKKKDAAVARHWHQLANRLASAALVASLQESATEAKE